MKKDSYGRLISTSWNWMIQILFRPFSLKKWIMLGIIIFLAGQMGGGNFNFNLKGDKGDINKIISSLGKKAPIITEEPAPLELPSMPDERGELGLPQDIAPQEIAPQLEGAPKMPPLFKDPKRVGLAALVIVPLILFIGLIIILWMWVKANFSFVFIDSIIRDDASLRVPFHRNKAQGNSFFWWSVAYSCVVLLTLGAIISSPIAQLIKAGAFTAKPPIDATQIFSIIMNYVPILVASMVVFLLITIFAWDFVLPIMYKRKIGILKAWGVFFGLLKRNIGEMLLYLLVKIGLIILSIIFAIILAIMGVIVFLVIGGLLALLGWLIYAITPGAAKPVILVILILIAIPTLAFLGFLFNLIFIPIAIFFRIFSIHVLGSMDESLDLFAPKPPEEIIAEAGDERYEKSMALVWFTVLAPLIFAIIGLLAAIAIPNFVKARKQALPGKPIDIKRTIERTIPSKIPAMPDFSEEEISSYGETATVYLKNGNSFDAAIIRESEDNVAFRIKGGTFILPRSDILRIER